MKLIFVRHGQTSWNLQRKLQGQLDIPLDDSGIIQTKLLCSRFKTEKIDIIFSSPLQRALDTALPVANFFNLGVICSGLISERNFGIIQGIKLKEIDQDVDKQIILKKTIDPTYKPKMGESLEELQNRIFKFLGFLNMLDNSLKVLCITHGGILDLIYRFSQNEAINAPRKWKIPNTGVNVFDYSNGKLLLKNWADTRHLENFISVDEL
tara:strand:+ start:187 stop:813 length:627 start_codon:yes stop_codon:yes gene_type:complete